MDVNLQLALTPPKACTVLWADPLLFALPSPCFALEKCGLPFLSWESLWLISLFQPPLDLRKLRLMPG